MPLNGKQAKFEAPGESRLSLAPGSVVNPPKATQDVVHTAANVCQGMGEVQITDATPEPMFLLNFTALRWYPINDQIGQGEFLRLCRNDHLLTCILRDEAVQGNTLRLT